MIPGIVDHLHFRKPVSGIVRLPFPVRAHESDINLEERKDLEKMLLVGIDHDGVDPPACGELEIPLLEALDRLVLVRAINGGVGLESDDEIVALFPALLKHEVMPGMRQVEGAARETDDLLSHASIINP